MTRRPGFFASLGHILRLGRAGFILAREGVFADIDPALLPPHAQTLRPFLLAIARKRGEPSGKRLARAIERLALKPEAVDVIASAYAASHRRLTDQIKPLCSAVLGDAASAERVGPTVCIAAIQANARRGDPSAARAALANVARAEAAERPLVPAPDASVLEKLASAIVNEPRAFKKELADKLGDADATRLATSPDLCGDWQVLNAGETRDGNRASPSGG